MIDLNSSVMLFIKLFILVQLFIFTNAEFYSRPGTSASEIIIARGYKARDYRYATPDGYKIRLTRGTNPLFDNRRRELAHRDPILFIHGILEDSSIFVINSKEIKGPQDFSKLNLNNAAHVAKVASSASARSLPFLAMDFGHEVWLMNRRGFPGSQNRAKKKFGKTRLLLIPEEEDDEEDDECVEEHYDYHDKEQHCEDQDYDDYDDHESCLDQRNPIDDGHKDYRDYDNRANNEEGDGEMIIRFGGQFRFSLAPFLALPDAFFQGGKLIENIIFSFDGGFWGFTLDQQAKFDVPLAIAHILNITKRSKVATATHSAGGGLLSMSLSVYPNLAGKLAANVMWSPGFCFGKSEGYKRLLIFKGLLQTYVGPMPPVWVAPPLQGLWGALCNIPFAPRVFCEWLVEFMNGNTNGQQPMYPEFMSTQFHPTSSREIAHFLQADMRGGCLHSYDYGPQRNRQIYRNRPDPPAYNLSAVTSRTITFYSTPQDSLIGPKDIQTIQSNMKVASKSKQIMPDFNHVGYFFHQNNAKMAIIPALRDIHGKAK